MGLERHAALSRRDCGSRSRVGAGRLAGMGSPASPTREQYERLRQAATVTQKLDGTSTSMLPSQGSGFGRSASPLKTMFSRATALPPAVICWCASDWFDPAAGGAPTAVSAPATPRTKLRRCRRRIAPFGRPGAPQLRVFLGAGRPWHRAGAGSRASGRRPRQRSQPRYRQHRRHRVSGSPPSASAPSTAGSPRKRPPIACGRRLQFFAEQGRPGARLVLSLDGRLHRRSQVGQRDVFHRHGVSAGGRSDGRANIFPTMPRFRSWPTKFTIAWISSGC